MPSPFYALIVNNDVTWPVHIYLLLLFWLNSCLSNSDRQKALQICCIVFLFQFEMMVIPFIGIEKWSLGPRSHSRICIKLPFFRFAFFMANHCLKISMRTKKNPQKYEETMNMIKLESIFLSWLIERCSNERSISRA